MKREILFRGFHPDENGTQEIWTDGTCNGEKVKGGIKGEWIEGYYFKIWDKCYILWGTTNDIPNMIEVIPETVQQFTDLTDKNGMREWAELQDWNLIKKIFRAGDNVEYSININGVDFAINDFYGFEKEFIQLIAKYRI